MTPTAFCKFRSDAITAYGAGKRTKWTVLGTGTIGNGNFGAIRVLDQFGVIGLVAQQYRGAKAGHTLSVVLADYIETRTQ